MRGLDLDAGGGAWCVAARGSRGARHLRNAVALGALGALGLIAGCSRSAPLRPQIALAPAPFKNRIDRGPGTPTSPRRYAERQSFPKGGGVYKLGSPYKVAGRWYVPTEDTKYDRAGIASWYGVDFNGRKTANGEVFDMNALTAAHPTLPLPCYAYVTAIATGRTVLVRVNDRGPYAANRIMDLSKRTAEVLGVAGKGVAEVRVRYAGRAPMSGDDRYERRFLASQPWANRLLVSQYGANQSGANQSGAGATIASTVPGGGFAGRMALQH